MALLIYSREGFNMSVTREIIRYSLLLLTLTFGAMSCPAQLPFAQAPIGGRVLDPNHAVIPAATITLQSVNSRFSVRTDRNGVFSLIVPLGEYVLKASAEGFAETVQTIRVTQAGSQPLEIVLPVAGSTATVTIMAADTLGYRAELMSSATRTLTPLRDLPQSITVVTREQIRDQSMQSIADVVNYVPGVTSHQGENNRDQLVIRGNSTSADFFLNGARDDAQYYRDLYNVDRVEALKGPNAMIFGRGGGGGVINRVTKEAGVSKLREFSLQGGAFSNRRVTADLGQVLSQRVAVRLNALYEAANSFRKHVYRNRYGISPSVSLMPRANTKITFGFEHFQDGRVADRGIPSFQGRPADVPIPTFFGNPKDSYANATVNLASAVIENSSGRLHIHNQTLFGDYDRGYQNFVPGAVTADKSQVVLSAYNNSTRRRNIFNQTDLTYALDTGRVTHTLMGGVEAGRQLTNNLRHTGFFNNTVTSILVPYDDPAISTPLTFRPSATDANNHLKANLGAAYAQDQIKLSQRVQLIAGLRFDYFDLTFHNNRTNENLRRIDRLISPRAGVVLKPLLALSIYGNYGVSYLPSSGDQFSSLTTITQQVKPEEFRNYEFGAKWDVRRNLALTTAVYRQDRTNTRATDPLDPTRILQTGSQRTNGVEVGLNGNITRSWSIAGGYANQQAFITSASTAAREGAIIAQVPRHTFSLWNKYQIHPKFGFGLGIVHRSDMFAAIDNAVTLPGYLKLDAAVYVPLNEKLRVQAHFENILNRKYYVNADGNNNISPGSPRGARIGLIARF